MKRCLVVLTGITVKPYGIDTIKLDPRVNSTLISEYGEENIFEIDYNQYLDSWTIQNEFNLKYLDPVRLKLNPFRRHKILVTIERFIKQKQAEGYIVDCLCHSQGCWVLALCKVIVNKVIFTGSPIGFENVFGRFMVRNSICPFPWSTPPLKCFEFINCYSPLDFVGNLSSTRDTKWQFSAQKLTEFCTNTAHDFGEYLHFLFKKGCFH